MDHVVAMDGVLSCPVAEAEKELNAFVLMQPRYVLPRNFEIGRRHAIARQDLVFFQMDVDRMLPITRQVVQDPMFHVILFNSKARFLRIDESSVDGPLAIQSVEFKAPRHTWRGGVVRQWVEHHRGRITAPISSADSQSLLIAVYNNLQDTGP